MARSISVTVSTWVDVDVDAEEFDDETIIEEVYNRQLEGQFRGDSDNRPVSMADEIKLEILLNGYKSKTIEEIERFFRG